VLYVTLRECPRTLGRQNDQGIVLVHDRETDEIVGLMVLDFWERFVQPDATLDQAALEQAMVAPFSGLVPDIRRVLLPA